MMNEEVEYRHSTAGPGRSPSRYVSQAFGFLNTYDDENTDLVVKKPDVFIEDSSINKNGLKNDGFKIVEVGNLYQGTSSFTDSSLIMSSKQNEFTIVTYVEDESNLDRNSTRVKSFVEDESNLDRNSTRVKSFDDNFHKEETDRKSPTLVEINPVYEVTDEEFHDLESKEVKANDNIVDEIKVTYNEKQEDTNEHVPNDETIKHVVGDKAVEKERLSVIVEGEIVELRVSPTDKRKSRQATWKTNQNIVSEAFNFLKDEGETGNTESVFISESNEGNSPNKVKTSRIVSEAFGFLKDLDDCEDTEQEQESQGTEVIDRAEVEKPGNIDRVEVEKPGNFDRAEVEKPGNIDRAEVELRANSGCKECNRNDSKSDSRVSDSLNVHSYSDSRASDSLNVHSYSDSRASDSLNVHSYSDSRASDSLNVHSYSDSRASDSLNVHSYSDSRASDSSLISEESSDKISELSRVRKRKPKLSQQSDSSGSNDDDGGSSDEDTGVYQESFRKSTWLYVGDTEETKRASKLNNYISIADMGIDTCDNDSVFGDIPPNSPTIPMGHKRNDSTATTASERDFKYQFNSVSKRFVKRADSQQEYKRYTTKCFENAKTVTIERDSQTEFGIHILDCKPAVISGVDAGSPAENAGLREGQILVSVNGINILESEHKDIINLVQRESTSLTVEVGGGGDLKAVIDLQIPIKTGYMHKQTSAAIFKSWKKRYFILRRDGCLYYYKNEQETDPLGAIPLNGYTVKRHGDSNKFSFKAEKYNCRTFFFMADNREDMTSWVGAMNEANEHGQNKDPWMDVTAQNVGLPALTIRNTDCAGYLYKMARSTRRWTKRYCVLKDACIYYYKNANSKEAEGVAHLHGYSVDNANVGSRKFSFSLHPPETQMRQFCFYTDNDTDKLRWLKALDTSIKKWIKVE